MDLSTFHRHPVVSATLAILSLFVISQPTVAQSAATPADQGGHRAEVEQWRKEREDAIASKSGWLSVAGLFFLKEGRIPLDETQQIS